MKVSYRWLSEYVDLTGYTASDLAEKLTRSGVEVDGVENLNKGVQGVVVGYVTSKEKHPDADKLNVCKVDVGQAEHLQIVCGAANVDAGQKVPVALVGAKLPDGFTIKRAKLRGIESQGMICSAKELGINDRYLPKSIQEGILVLPESTVTGDSILEVLGIDDEVLDLDLTPNRSDCLSMLGVAYEIAAILGREVKLPNTQEGLVEEAGDISEHVNVTVTSPEACERYTARYLEGIVIKQSPLWIQYRLMAAGIRPINNVVDITNYVMLEYGQPLHAFDAKKLAGRIDVRFATEGERLITLDDVDRELTSSMLLITDGEKPVGLAGVMGGANSEVTDETTSIVLESAKFTGSVIRRTSRQLGLRSEASLRFEKEVNPDVVVEALDRAAALMCLYAEGKAAAGMADVAAKVSEPRQVELSIAKVNSYLGTTLSASEIMDIITKLHFSHESGSSNSAGEAEVLLVNVPGRRGDIIRDVDLIEEVARLYGYDNIPTTLMGGVTTPGALSREQHIRRSLRKLLTESGIHEAITYSLTQPEQIELISGLYPESVPVSLAMPMSEDRSTLRTSLLPHLLEAAQYNRNRNIEDIALFEIGKVFITDEAALTRQPEEHQLLSILLTGKRSGPHWTAKPEKVDYYDIKGVFEKIEAYLNLPGISFRKSTPDGFHPGRTADIISASEAGEVFLGRIGQLHPDLRREMAFDDIYVLEVDLDQLIKLADTDIAYRTLPRYPSISRDIAVVINKDVPVGELLADVRKTAGALLETSGVFDIYTGERLGENRKSAAISLVYRHPEHTLTDEEVAEVHGKVLTSLEQTFAAELRK